MFRLNLRQYGRTDGKNAWAIFIYINNRCVRVITIPFTVRYP